MKNEEPHDLRNWKRTNQATPQNLNYGGGNFPSESVRKALISEQLHLCAYTMKSLKTALQCEAQAQDTSYSCHIEHVLPQARKIDAETIDFQNMLACFPASRSNTACAYGAYAKASYDPAKNVFVSPLRGATELHFKFYRDGRVEGLTPEGKITIKVLRLDHASLTSDRAAVIKGRLEPKPGKPLTAAAARRLAQDILKPDTHHCLPAFCVAIAQAAIDHAEREERRANRLKKIVTS